MVLLDELRVTMSDYRKDLKELYEVLGIEKAQARYDALQKQVSDPDFYSDLENSQKVLQEVKSLENRIEKYQKMEETLDDILTLIELTVEEGEEFQQTALREVLEESGSRASIIKYVGKSEYTFNVPEDVVEKEVHWYLMMADSYYSKPQREE